MNKILKIFAIINIIAVMTILFVQLPDKVKAGPPLGEWDIEIDVCGNSGPPNYTVLWDGRCVFGNYDFCYHMMCGYLASSN